MNQLIEKEKLMKYVPHRGKMFLLSRITCHDVEKFTVTAEADIDKDFIFYDESLGGIPNWCTFEIMAQAVSALTGIHDSFHKIEPKAGCILSVSDFKSSVQVFKLGTTVKVKAFEEYRDEENGIYRYCCSAFVSPDAEEPAVTAVLTVMQAENMESILNH